MNSDRLLLGVLGPGIAFGILSLTTAPGAPENNPHENRTATAFKTPPGGTTVPTGRTLQVIATIDVSRYSHVRLAAHAETSMVLYASIVQDGEEIAQLLPGYPVGSSGPGGFSPFTLDFAVPGQVLQIKAENIDPVDGRLSLVVYGRE